MTHKADFTIIFKSFKSCLNRLNILMAKKYPRENYVKIRYRLKENICNK